MTNLLVAGCERQQRDIPSLLDRAREATLVGGANTGQAARHYLAALSNELLQQAYIAIVD
jgi:hypothetical protein